MQAEHKTTTDPSELSKHVRRIGRRRSPNAVMIFLAAVLCAIVAPWLGFALVCCALFSYLVPELRPFLIVSKPQT